MILGVVGTELLILSFKANTDIACFATSVTYLIPVVAFFWGLDNEMLTRYSF
jgi:hypothetical protein